MKKSVKLWLVTGMLGALTGCASFTSQPYSPAPNGVSIGPNAHGGFQVNRVLVKRTAPKPAEDTLQFCFAQNIPGINGTPLLNSTKTRIAAQGKDQVSFVVPMSMGTALSYEIMFSVTASHDSTSINFDFTNLRIRGTWTPNEVPLPGSQDANQYVESAVAKLNKISDSVASCLLTEG